MAVNEKKLLLQQIFNALQKGGILSKEIIANEALYQKSLFDTVQMDSFGLIKLIVCLETEFSIEFEDQYLVKDNFSTLNKIADIVSKATSAS